MRYSITTFRQLYYACKEQGKQIFEVALENEVDKGEYSEYQVRLQAAKSLNAMKEAIKEGLKSVELSPSGMSGDDCNKLQKRYEKAGSLLGTTAEKIMIYALATSEQNLRMGTIAACPTAGSCGIVPAVLETLAEELDADEDTVIKAYVVASGTGALAVENATVSGAEGGCQAECGVAAAMAAAGAVYMKGGSAEECIESFAISLINIMGLVCDPVAGLVQIPCAQRNASQAVNALLSADLAMGGMKCGIDADEVIESMYRVGKLMPVQHRETSLGGIAVTASAKEYEEALKNM